MDKNAHLTYDEQLTIPSSLADRRSFKEIGLIPGKDLSTISKDIKGHLAIVEKESFNPCLHCMTYARNKDVCKTCRKKFSPNCRTCTEACYKTRSDYVEKHCLTILKPPYVCNGCTERHKCKLQRHLCKAVRSESRQGFAIPEDEPHQLLQKRLGNRSAY